MNVPLDSQTAMLQELNYQRGRLAQSAGLLGVAFGNLPMPQPIEWHDAASNAYQIPLAAVRADVLAAREHVRQALFYVEQAQHAAHG